MLAALTPKKIISLAIMALRIVTLFAQESKAKKQNSSSAVTVLLKQLLQNGFYISSEVFDYVKSEAGE